MADIFAGELTDSPYCMNAGELMVSLTDIRFKDSKSVTSPLSKLQLGLLTDAHVGVAQQVAEVRSTVSGDV